MVHSSRPGAVQVEVPLPTGGGMYVADMSDVTEAAKFAQIKDGDADVGRSRWAGLAHKYDGYKELLFIHILQREVLRSGLSLNGPSSKRSGPIFC